MPSDPQGLPSVALTVVITFFFGLFGLIPASTHANRARRAGVSGSKYWKAFWITFIVEFLCWLAVTVLVMVAIAHAANQASERIDDLYSSVSAFPTEEPTYDPTDDPTYDDDSPTYSPSTVSSGKSFTGTQFSWTQTSETGDTTAITLELGTPITPSDAPDVTGGTAQDALDNCDIDQERDLLVPFDLSMTNTDDSLSQQVETNLYLATDDSFGDGESVGRVAFYDEGPDCDSGESDGGKLIGVESTDSIAAGSSSDTGGYIVLSQAVSPNNPDGDPALLDARLLPLDVAPGDTDEEGTSFSTDDGPWQDGGIPLGGGAS